MTVSAQTMEWLHWVSRTSLPLYRLDGEETPVGVASGCLANIGGRKLVLSVSHATGRGRWIPSTSVDEYSATLATWFGVSASDLRVVLPNIGRFAKPNLGFM